MNETLRSRTLSKMYERDAQTLLRSSGSGNNFAHGFFEYGEQLGETFLDMMQHQVEACDNLEAIGILHSLGGGTGSGLGTKLLADLADAMPKTFRFTTSVLPSPRAQDVVTSPYNMVLSLAQLTEFADIVLPIDNCKLADLATEAHKYDTLCGIRSTKFSTPNPRNRCKPSPVVSSSTCGASTSLKPNPKPIRREGFSSMTTTVARLLIDLTAGTRFNGDSCTRIGEIITQLNRPRIHYLTSSMAPLVGIGSTPEAYRSMEVSQHMFVFPERSDFIQCLDSDHSVDY